MRSVRDVQGSLSTTLGDPQSAEADVSDACHRLGTASDLQFRQHIRDVISDRLRAQDESVGDRGIGGAVAWALPNPASRPVTIISARVATPSLAMMLET